MGHQSFQACLRNVRACTESYNLVARICMGVEGDRTAQGYLVEWLAGKRRSLSLTVVVHMGEIAEKARRGR